MSKKKPSDSHEEDSHADRDDFTSNDNDTSSFASSNSRNTDKKSVIKSTGNVRTLSQLKQLQDAESSEDEDGQAFYAGGSEHSGQQVLGPPKGRRSDIVSEMFRSVREFGAEIVESHASHSREGHSNVFTGTGYRLGETNDDSEVVVSKKSDNTQVEITLKFWKNGFSVNNGPLRIYDDPKNREFLHHIKHGEVPTELLMQAQGREISFNMEDYRHAEFVQVAPKISTFTGAGQKLGSVTPVISSPSLASDNASSNDDNDIKPNPVELDNSQPTTNIQIRLADGSRLVGTFNHYHTIGDIRTYINTLSPQYRNRRYIILSSFPRKELSNEADTIQQSGLINSVVMQHLVA